MSNEEKAALINRLGRFYTSPYVAKNQPWVLKTPYKDWLRLRLLERGITL